MVCCMWRKDLRELKIACDVLGDSPVGRELLASGAEVIRQARLTKCSMCLLHNFKTIEDKQMLRDKCQLEVRALRGSTDAQTVGAASERAIFLRQF